MLPFSTLILRSYYEAIGWNLDNSYSQLNRSSDALIDFQIPQSLILQLANAPTPMFFTSYSLDALPQLNGSLSYITTSEALERIGPSATTPFRYVVDRFKVYPPPHRPPPKDEIWQGGRRVEGRDYLLYSRLHLPSLHLSGLATTRLTSTLQAHLAFLSQPSAPVSRPSSPNTAHTRQPSSSESAPPASTTPSNILLSLQHDTGRWSGEYTYSAQDGMFGMRGLYNFGWRPDHEAHEDLAAPLDGSKRIDEEEMMDGGLRGRFSAGGEVYFSAKQRSFGVSTGLRFSTIPTALPVAPGSPAPSPPTTLTLLYNPLIGFLSSAYSAQVSPTVAVSSRFGVNVYSYESDLSIGGEWWIGRRRGKRDMSRDDTTSLQSVDEAERIRSKEAALSEASLRDDRFEDTTAEAQLDSPVPLTRNIAPSPTTPVSLCPDAQQPGAEERDGVLKARISGDWSIALLYEARIRKCLVSVGVVSDLLSRQRPIQSVGLEVQYFS